jgi:hypothetical protein
VFSDAAKREIEACVAVVSSSDEARAETVKRLGATGAGADGVFLIASTRRFLGQGLRLAVTATPPEGLDALRPVVDLIIVLDEGSLAQARELAATRPGAVCLLLVNCGAPRAAPAWEISGSPEELPGRCLDEVLLGIEQNRLQHELRLTDPSTREALERSARVEVLGHVGESWGECVEEFMPTPLPVGRPYWFVAAFAPREGGPFWSYATVGLSLSPQQATRLELVAYSREHAPAVADALLTVCSLVERAAPEDPALAAGHTIELEGSRFFGLVRAPEADSFHAFPSREVSSFGLIAGPAQVAFLQLVPITAEEGAEAQQTGADALVARLGRTGARRAEGWEPLSRTTSARPWWKFWS